MGEWGTDMSVGRRIGLALCPDVEELDAVGPWEVLASWTTALPEDGWSVCTGSVVFAATGLLAGRPATTRWASLDRLTDLGPSIEVRREERYVDDGDILTSAGMAAGIDMALHLVARLAGVDRARQVRRGIHYDPAPPH